MKKAINVAGWQSWSYPGHRSRGLPKRYFSPFGQDKFVFTPKKITRKRAITGWCSWHWFGSNINQDIILNQAKFIAKNRRTFPVEYILVDDGWCKWGDWLEPDTKKFPLGMKHLAQDIKKLGLKPGIWIAPFLAAFSSHLFHRYPEWFTRDSHGNIVEGTKVGPLDFMIPSKRGILDLRNPKVQTYLKKVIDSLEDWGYQLVKLDFLYAGHYNPTFLTSEKPDQLLNDFLRSIKRSHPNIYTIACGSPLKSAISAVDAIRISDDINFPQLKYIWPFNSYITSQRLNQLEANLKHRSILSRVVHLDLDAFICHRAHGISSKQILRLQEIIKNSHGPKFLGDDLTKLTKQEVEKFIKPLFIG